MDSSGNYLSQFGSLGSTPGEFAAAPGAIALDGAGNVYVIDYGGPDHRAHLGAGDGRYLALPIDPSGHQLLWVVR